MRSNVSGALSSAPMRLRPRVDKAIMAPAVVGGERAVEASPEIVVDDRRRRARRILPPHAPRDRGERGRRRLQVPTSGEGHSSRGGTRACNSSAARASRRPSHCSRTASACCRCRCWRTSSIGLAVAAVVPVLTLACRLAHYFSSMRNSCASTTVVPIIVRTETRNGNSTPSLAIGASQTSRSLLSAMNLVAGRSRL